MHTFSESLLFAILAYKNTLPSLQQSQIYLCFYSQHNIFTTVKYEHVVKFNCLF